LALFARLAFAAAVAWWPYPSHLDRPAPAGTWLEDRHGVPLAAFVAGDDQWRLPLGLDQISPHLLNALVAVEDGRFYEHAGVDWRAVAAATWQNAAALRVRRGASTLTMQVQRLRDPTRRTLWNKVEQAVRACQLERRYTKRDILAEYVNGAPFGGNLVGAGAASWRYFAKPCAELSLGEAALLAGLPKNPNHYRPDRHPRRAAARRDHVLDRMLDLGFITPEQHAEARAEMITAAWRPLPHRRDDGALPMLIALAADHPGESVRTTLDLAVQRQAAVAAAEQLRLLAPSGVTAAAVVVLDTQTAECLAAVSVAPTAPGVDLTRRPRSTGSVLKPFIYAAAFEAGACAPSSQIDDSPTAWPGYTPQDYDRRFRGAMTAAEALAESRNIPAMVVLSQVGVERAVGVMDAAGLKTLAKSGRNYGLSLAIGGAEATVMEVAEAYATLGRGGACREVRLFRKGDGLSPSPILMGEGRGEGLQSGISNRRSQIEDPHPVSTRPLPEYRAGEIARTPSGATCLTADACWQTLAALAIPERTTHVSPAAARSHVAWKTGTSSGHRDAWCAAVTPRRTVVVWLGNPAGQSSSSLVGQEAAAPLALRLIAALDQGPAAPWPAVAQDAPPVVAAADVPAARGDAPTLVMVSPAAGRQYVLSPDVPAERQRVLLKAAYRGAEAREGTVWWFVDGEPAGSGGVAEPFWWEPTPGSHEVRVVDARGKSAAVRVRVRS
jgi:penicillin-binding protein 1C